MNMTDISAPAFQALRQSVHDTPSLHEHLFNLTDTDDFIAAVRQLASAQGHDLNDEDVRQALHSGRKAWIERNRT
jgi:hypothetical protein